MRVGCFDCPILLPLGNISSIGIPTDESPSPPPKGFLADRRKVKGENYFTTGL